MTGNIDGESSAETEITKEIEAPRASEAPTTRNFLEQQCERFWRIYWSAYFSPKYFLLM